MPALADVLAPEDIRLHVTSSSKRHLLGEIATCAARLHGVDQAAVLAALNERERLGSTGVGQGVALPHARLKGLERLTGLFWRLAEPIDYDAIDDAPVDLIFVLLVPQDNDTQHLKALAKIARRLREPSVRERLRRCEDNREAWDTLMGSDGIHEAA